MRRLNGSDWVRRRRSFGISTGPRRRPSNGGFPSATRHHHQRTLVCTVIMNRTTSNLRSTCVGSVFNWCALTGGVLGGVLAGDAMGANTPGPISLEQTQARQTQETTQNKAKHK